ncbi:MAG: hypothetical protein QOE31_2597 [Solirubrobacteraceae bacterium]|nr:hypothetical protein [Solirubrobacteraceae bacterium]
MLEHVGDASAGHPRPSRTIIYNGGTSDLSLPPAQPLTRHPAAGGLRTTHELAFAIAATGRAVELRGAVDMDTYAQLAAVTHLAPQLPASALAPQPGDVVVVPEGDDDPLGFGRVLLSGARLVVLALGPPGLTGWPWVGGWSRPSPLTVQRESLARPEHFRAMAAAGVTIWSHTARIAELAEAAGVRCRFIGNGSPIGMPAPTPKPVDVVWLRFNRWASLAEPIAAGLPGRVDAIAQVPHDELLRRLDGARILLFPSRIEGHSRIMSEARAAGCVPVALASNDFATGLSEKHGAVPVRSLEAMRGVIESLLRDPVRVAQLAERGRASAREQLDWQHYVERVDTAVREAHATPVLDAEVRAIISSRVAQLLTAATGQSAALQDDMARLARRFGGLEAEAAGLREALELERDRLRESAREVARLTAAHDRAARDHAALRARKAVRLALRAADLRPRRARVAAAAEPDAGDDRGQGAAPPPPAPARTGCDINAPAPGATISRGLVTISGWALLASGPPARVDLELGGVAIGPARLGLARPDVRAALGRPSAAVSGFEQLVDLTRWPGCDGDALLRGVATGLRGERMQLGPIALRIAPAPARSS